MGVGEVERGKKGRKGTPTPAALRWGPGNEGTGSGRSNTADSQGSPVAAPSVALKDRGELMG